MSWRVLLPCLASLCASACGGTVATADSSVSSDASNEVDAGADVATDGKAPCLPNGEPSTSPNKCCSFHTKNDVCTSYCFLRTSTCKLPDQPCCADAGACVNGTCQ